MKRITTIFIFDIVIVLNCFGQDSLKSKYVLKDMGDTYVVQIILDTAVFKHKSSCAFLNAEPCWLFKGKVSRIYKVPNNTVFDSTALSNVKYFIIDAKTKVTNHMIYTATLMPGTTTRYLVVNRILNINKPETFIFINNEVYLSGLSTCKKIGLLNNFFFTTGLKNKEKFNFDKRSDKKDFFDNYISSHIK